MKIIHILGDSKYGGAAKSIIRLAQRWETAGWEARILTTDPQFHDAAIAAGVKTANVDCIWREIRPLHDLIGLFRLWRYLRAEGFTVAHTHTTKAGFVGRIAARLAGIPVVIHTIHGFAFHERSSPPKIAFYTALETIAGWCCQRIVTVSEFHRAWALRLHIAPPAKLFAIPNGIPDGAVTSPASRAALRASLNIADNQLLVFTPGRVATEKGLEELLEAAAQLPPALVSQLRFVIAGDGPLLPELQQRIAALNLGSRVTLLGFRDDIAALHGAADIVVLPSWREGLSIALLESMCAGRAIVATTIGSNLEALRALDGSAPAALWMDPGDVPALVGALTRLAANPDLRQRLGRRAREIWERNYTVDRYLSTHEAAYYELLTRHGCFNPESTAATAGNLP